MAWEVDCDTLELVAADGHLDELAGLDLVGRTAWMDVVPDGDRERLLVAGLGLRHGERTQVLHRLMHTDAAVVWMHTTMVGSVAADGRRTVCGVSIRWTSTIPGSPGIHSPHEARHARIVVRRRPHR